MRDKLMKVLQTTARILTFRATREDFEGLGNKHLLFGILCTWLVGFGRTWDKPEVNLLQRTGLGSVVYIFILTAILWTIFKPLAVPGSTYRRLLTFISLVSPPGLLYAIPVEKFLDAYAAAVTNMWFLAVVATWRVALLAFYLRTAQELRGKKLRVLTLYPLSLIVGALTLCWLWLDIMFGMAMGIPLQKGEPEGSQSIITLMLKVKSFPGADFIAWLGVAAVVSCPFLYFHYTDLVQNRRIEQLKAPPNEPSGT